VNGYFLTFYIHKNTQPSWLGIFGLTIHVLSKELGGYAKHQTKSRSDNFFERPVFLLCREALG
jgi:hypothetical protein